MAKKSMIARDKKREELTIKYFNKRNRIKLKIRGAKSVDEQLKIQELLQKLPRNSLIIRQRKRCKITGRSRGYSRDFGLSRHILREMAHNCLIPGLKKSSW